MPQTIGQAFILNPKWKKQNNFNINFKLKLKQTISEIVLNNSLA